MSQATPLPPGALPIASPSPRGATRLLRSFAAHGVRAAFGIPGGAAGPLFDALTEVPDIELVCTRQESTAVFAALGHARATGIPALVLVTAGPGVTNTLTGIATAHLEEIPLIVVGGDVATASLGRGAFQDSSHAGLDVVGLMRNVTRFCASVCAPSMIAGAAERAWAAATGPKEGPVFLSVPYDVGYAASAHAGILASAPSPPLEPDVSGCLAARDLVLSARRPLMVLGSGARGGVAHAVRLAEALGMPVVVTSHAKGAFPERHPLYLGLIGIAGHPSANDYLASNPDVVLVVGSRLGDFATNGWRLGIAGRTATIQIDRDPLLIGRNAPVTLGIVGDAAATLSAILALLPKGAGPSRERPAGLTRKAWTPDAPFGTVKPQHLVTALGEAFPDAIFCADIGEHMSFAQHYLSVDGPEHFHCMSAYGSMGSGIGAAIGMQRAKPEATVVALAGDGGFNMHASEILTCVEQNIGVIFAIFNDGCWNMVEHGFKTVFSRKPRNLPRKVANLAAVARGYGADACVIDRPELLEPRRLRALVRRGTPLVLDARIDRNESLSATTRSHAFTR